MCINSRSIRLKVLATDGLIESTSVYINIEIIQSTKIFFWLFSPNKTRHRPGKRSLEKCMMDLRDFSSIAIIKATKNSFYLDRQRYLDIYSVEEFEWEFYHHVPNHKIVLPIQAKLRSNQRVYWDRPI